jgi:hypothetical protein
LEDQRGEVFYPGEGNLTNEAISKLQGRLDESADHALALESTEDFLTEVEEIGKRKRDIPGRLSGTG